MNQTHNEYMNILKGLSVAVILSEKCRCYGVGFRPHKKPRRAPFFVP